MSFDVLLLVVVVVVSVVGGCRSFGVVKVAVCMCVCSLGVSGFFSSSATFSAVEGKRNSCKEGCS